MNNYKLFINNYRKCYYKWCENEYNKNKINYFIKKCHVDGCDNFLCIKCINEYKLYFNNKVHCHVCVDDCDKFKGNCELLGLNSLKNYLCFNCNYYYECRVCNEPLCKSCHKKGDRCRYCEKNSIENSEDESDKEKSESDKEKSEDESNDESNDESE